MQGEDEACMLFEKIVSNLNEMGLNLYEVALYTPDGVQTHRFQPCNRSNDCYSVAKAFVMTAIGFLWEDGLLSMTDPIEKYFFKEFRKGIDPGWRMVTIEHALTHRLGFLKGFLDIDVEDMTQYPVDDYLSMVFNHPLAYVPGTRTQYSDAAFYLLSRLVDHVCGEKLDRLLHKRLFKPMSFGETAWSCCPLGYPIGATGLYMSVTDMLKLGALYLNGGLYGNQRILSSEWVSRVIAHEYEFHSMTPGGLIGKGGMYGQLLAFSREKGFAIACHAHEERKVGDRLIRYLDEVTP